MGDQFLPKAVRLAVVAALLAAEPFIAIAQDEIDILIRRGQMHPEWVNEHGYSDFTDPVGRFLDLLAAGAFREAKSMERDACAAWQTTRQNSPYTGRVWVWDTEIQLDKLCAHH